MNVPFFIAKRIAFNNQRSFSRFIIRLAAAATALSVAAMIITLAFVNGFQQTVSKKVFSFWGHIRVQQYEPDKAMVAEETPLPQNDTVVKIMQNTPGVKHFQAFATKSAVLEKNKEIEAILFKGVSSNYDYSNLKPFMVEGRWINFAEDSLYSREIIISQPIANELQIKLNDEINIHFISTQKGTTNTRKLKVCGIYKTGIEEFDKLFALGDINLLRKINNWNNGEIGGYEVFLDDYNDIETISPRLDDALPQAWISRSIKQIYPYIFDWLNIQDVNRIVIFIVMAVVAIINLITCLLILVLERTRMVGVLKAVGSPDWTIQQIFLYHGAIVAFTGIIIGFAAGIGICLLQQHFGFLTLNESAYYVSVAPVDIIWWQVAAVCVVTLLVCVLALLIPSILVKYVKPIKAIQFR